MPQGPVHWETRLGQEAAESTLHKARIAAWQPIRNALDEGASVLVILRESVESGDEMNVEANRQWAAAYLGTLGRAKEAAQLAKVLSAYDEAQAQAKTSVLSAIDQASGK